MSNTFLAGVALLSVAAIACGGKHTTTATEDAGHDAGPTMDAATGEDAAPTDASDAGDAGITRTLITEPDAGMTPVYDFLSSAKKTIDMTMYELEDPMIDSILIGAVKNGVTVRVILDQNLEMSDNTSAYDALMGGGVDVHWANPTYAATHQKTITIDGATSAVMSLNLASDDYATSRDFAVVTNDPADVAAIEATFADDLTNTAVTPSTGTDLVWSPTNAEPSLVGLIGSAKTSILLENEEMSDYEIVDALTKAASSGVDVKVVMEASSEWDSNFDAIVMAGGHVATYHHAALYIHAKVIIVDFGQSDARVFVGSENFSNASLTENRELGTILTDSAIMTGLNSVLTSDFAGGTTYTGAD